MMKKFLAIAFVALSLSAISANAQQTCRKDCTDKTECTKNCDKQCDKKCDKDNKACPGQMLFSNMNLTDDQKNQLQQLNQARMESHRQKAEAARGEKQRGDSTARAARHEERRQYLQSVKDIVGPENYVIFLENSYLFDQQPGKMMGGRHEMAPAKKGVKAQKGEDRQKGERREHKKIERRQAQ